MNVFARVESVCARVVEDAFARVFPSALDPAQIGRRLVATAQSAPSDMYLVRVHPADYARLAVDRDFLEARWSAMLREAHRGEREGVRVVLDEDPDVVAGSLAIDAVTDEHLAPLLFVRRDGTRIPLADGLTLGRADDCGVVLRDPRVSRHHARILADGTTWAIEDTGSANGTWIDATRVDRARLAAGQTVTLGDTFLKVVEAP